MKLITMIKALILLPRRLSLQTFSNKILYSQMSLLRNASTSSYKHLTFQIYQPFCKSEDYVDKAVKLIEAAHQEKSKGNYDDALMHYQMCYQLTEAHEGKKSPNTAQILKSIAIMHCLKQENTKALELMKYCEKMFEQIYLEADINLANFYKDFGSVCTHTKNNQEALKHFEKALEVMILLDGGQISTNSVPLLTIIAQIYFQSKNITQAKEILLKCEQILNKDKSVTVDSATISQVYRYLAYIYEQVDDPEKALQYHEKLKQTESDNTQKLSETNQSEENELYSMGQLYAKNKQIQKALESFHKSLDIVKKRQGQQSQPTLDAMFNIANQLDKCSYSQQALHFFNSCMKLIIEICPNTLTHARILNRIAIIMYEQGQGIEGKKKAIESLPIYEKLFPEGSEQLAIVLTSISVFSTSAENEEQESIEYRKKSIEMFHKILGTYNQPRVIESLSFLAVKYYTLNKFEESLVQSSRAYEASLAVYGKDHKQTKTIQQFIQMVKKQIELKN